MKFFTPVLALVFFGMIITSCEDDDPTDDPAANPIFVEFVIDGDTIRYEDDVDGYGNGPGVDSFQDSLGRLHSQFTTFGRAPGDSTTANSFLTIQMVKLFAENLDTPAYDVEFALFNAGAYEFGSFNRDSTPLGVNGVVIAYTDADGEEWSSDVKFGTQPSGSFFTISEHTAVDATAYGAKTRGTFRCTVFDGQGGSLELNDGSFYARTVLK